MLVDDDEHHEYDETQILRVVVVIGDEIDETELFLILILQILHIEYDDDDMVVIGVDVQLIHVVLDEHEFVIVYEVLENVELLLLDIDKIENIELIVLHDEQLHVVIDM